METRKSLSRMNACSDVIDWYIEHKKNTLLLTLEEATEEKQLNYFNWYISRKLTEIKKVEYAVFAAEQVIELFEKRYPNDNRPRKSIEAAKSYIKNPSKENRIAAAYAANAAYTAADAYAAYAAAYAAIAADDAANAAVDAAARFTTKKKIIIYGLNLLKEEGIE